MNGWTSASLVTLFLSVCIAVAPACTRAGDQFSVYPWPQPGLEMKRQESNDRILDVFVYRGTVSEVRMGNREESNNSQLFDTPKVIAPEARLVTASVIESNFKIYLAALHCQKPWRRTNVLHRYFELSLYESSNGVCRASISRRFGKIVFADYSLASFSRPQMLRVN